MSDDRITNLEISLAHQDQMLQELSDLVHKQWDEIAQLKRLIQRLEETKADVAADEADRKPPHY